MNNENNRNGFKMTEIGWLPEEWKVAKLGDIVATFSGGTPRRDISEYWGGTIEWLKSGELADSKLFSSEEKITELGLKNSSTKFVEEDTLLIAMYGATAGKVGLVRKRLTINQAICAILPNENFFSEFYFYYFIFIRPQLLSERFGGAQPNLNQQIIKNIKIPLPPLSEQKKIAAVLSAVQEAREKTEAVIAAAKELKKSLMKYLFTYGPVPVTEADKVRLKETEIGVMPEEWELKTVQESVDSIEYGLSLSIPENEDDNGIPILSTADITKDGEILYNKIRKIKIQRKLNDRLLLKNGDVMFNWRNSPELIGKTSVFETNKNENVTYASFILRIRCDELTTHNYFLKYLFNYYREKGVFIKLARRAVNQANYNKNEIFVLKIQLPPIEIQMKIASTIKIIDEKIEKEQSKKQALDQLFKSLLHNLMTGKIRVNHLEL